MLPCTLHCVLLCCLKFILFNVDELQSELNFRGATPGGYSHQNRTYMCLLDFTVQTVRYTYFCQMLPPINIPISLKKHPLNFAEIGGFLQKIAPNTPNLAFWAHLCAICTHPSIYQFSPKKTPKNTGTGVYHVNVRTPRGATRSVYQSVHMCDQEKKVIFQEQPQFLRIAIRDQKVPIFKKNGCFL